MTTDHQHAGMTDTDLDAGTATANAEPTTDQTAGAEVLAPVETAPDSGHLTGEPLAPTPETPAPVTISATTTPSTTAPSTADSSTAEALFAEGDLADMRSRWSEVQAGFVDDPRDCVQKADGLVSDVVEQLSASFSQARARLEEQWARGEDASTEDLRLALKRYREFFDRLLAV